MSNYFNLKVLIYYLLIKTITAGNYSFDFIAFGPSRFTTVTSSVWTLGLRSFYMSDDNKYMIISFTSPSNTLEPDIIYRRQDSGYIQIGKIICSDCSGSNQVGFNGIQVIAFSKDSKRLFVSNTFFVRIFQMREKETYYQIQKIASSSASIFLSKDDRFLLIKSNYNSQVAKLINSTGVYDIIYNVTVTGFQTPSARALSGDGLFMVDNLNLNHTSSLNVYGFQNNTYVLLSQFNLGMLTSTVKSIVISGVVSPGRYRVIISSTSLLQYYDLLTTSSPLEASLSLVQVVSNQTGYVFTTYLTNNGMYLLYSPSITSQKASNYFYLSTFDNATRTFQISYQHPGILTNKVTKLYVNQNSDILVIGSQFDFYNPWNPTFCMAFYFPCDVQNCQKCSWIRICNKCINGLILLNNSCVCPQGYSIVNSACVSCNISSCSACNSSNTCSICQATYLLQNNTCHCPTGWTKSALSNSCFECNIQNCLRCDQTDVCALYSNSDLIKQIQNLTNRLNQSSNQLIIVNSSSNGQAEDKKTSEEISQIKLMLIVLSIIMVVMIAIMAIFVCYILKKKILISDFSTSQKGRSNTIAAKDKSKANRDNLKIGSQLMKTQDNMFQANNFESFQISEVNDSIALKKRPRKRRQISGLTQETVQLQIKEYSNSIDIESL